MILITDLLEQYKSIKDEIRQAIDEVLESGYFILGEQLKALENEFAKYCNIQYAVGVASGTDALFLSLFACGIKGGDEVITVANTAIPTINAISFASAKPVFVDINPKSYNIDVNLIESAITDRTKAIIPVHLFGQMAEMDKIMEIANKYNLKVIEDCAQAHGAEYKGKKAGTFGHCGCFSFYPTKNLGAYGDGGMVITSDESIANQIRLLRHHGQEKRYYHIIKGYNSRLDEMQSAILRIKLKHLDEWNEKRRTLAKLYNELFKDTDIITPVEIDNAKHIYHLYVIRAQRRDELQDYLQRNGVLTHIHYPIPAHLQQAYRDMNIPEGSLPITEKYAKEILSLPMYPELTEHNVKTVVELIKKFF